MVRTVTYRSVHHQGTMDLSRGPLFIAPGLVRFIWWWGPHALESPAWLSVAAGGPPNSTLKPTQTGWWAVYLVQEGSPAALCAMRGPAVSAPKQCRAAVGATTSAPRRAAPASPPY